MSYISQRAPFQIPMGVFGHCIPHWLYIFLYAFESFWRHFTVATAHDFFHGCLQISVQHLCSERCMVIRKETLSSCEWQNYTQKAECERRHERYRVCDGG